MTARLLHFHTDFPKKPFLRHPMGNCSTLSLAAASHTNCLGRSAGDARAELLGMPGSSGTAAPHQAWHTKAHLPFIHFFQCNTNMN